MVPEASDGPDGEGEGGLIDHVECVPQGSQAPACGVPAIGASILRNLDSIKFPCEVTSVDIEQCTCEVLYPDGVREAGVGWDEVEAAVACMGDRGNSAQAQDGTVDDMDSAPLPEPAWSLRLDGSVMHVAVELPLIKEAGAIEAYVENSVFELFVKGIYKLRVQLPATPDNSELQARFKRKQGKLLFAIPCCASVSVTH